MRTTQKWDSTYWWTTSFYFCPFCGQYISDMGRDVVSLLLDPCRLFSHVCCSWTFKKSSTIIIRNAPLHVTHRPVWCCHCHRLRRPLDESPNIRQCGWTSWMAHYYQTGDISTAFHFTNDEIFQKCFEVCVFGCLDQIGPDAGGGGQWGPPKNWDWTFIGPPLWYFCSFKNEMICGQYRIRDVLVGHVRHRANRKCFRWNISK